MKEKKSFPKFLKISLIIAVVAAVLVGLVAQVPSNKQKNEKREILSEILKISLKNYHFTSKEINDDFSKMAFKLYIERLDYSKRFLLQEDIDKLKEYELKIDDEINANKFDFFNLSIELINKRTEEVKKIYPEILKRSFDFSDKDSIETDPDKYDFVANKKELKNRWKEYLKFQVLEKIVQAEEEEKKLLNNPDTNYTKLSFSKQEEIARLKVQKMMDEWFKRVGQINEQDRLSNYINAITSVYDPHSNYFPPQDKENFDITMSGKLEGIGATLQEKDGFIKVVDIVAGSASWREGQLKAGHIILKVGQASAEPVSIVDMRLDEAVKLIRGPKGTEVRLTIRDLDGIEKVISIIRDIVILEETYAKSIVVYDSTKTSKFGYIYLPKFYRDFNDAKGRSCAEDVKKEIEKLSKENIKGLIIDLRDNGGGSLQDVVEMGGLFIEKGPIVQVKPRDEKPYIMEDMDPTVQYTGPLLIMVNELSASASEILAAAMQDYKRAIIMGSEATYGKGTVQRFIDLDAFLSGNYKKYSPLGSVKLTIQKFYRINGGATQIKGVNSDILLPDQYQYLQIGENEMDHPMVWDEIQPVSYTIKQDYVTAFLPELKQKSQARILKDSTFIQIKNKAKFLRESQDATMYSINHDQYSDFKKKRTEVSKQYENSMKEIPGLKSKVSDADYNDIKSDTTKVKRMEQWQKELKKDAYLFEAIQVLNDYVK